MAHRQLCFARSSISFSASPTPPFWCHARARPAVEESSQVNLARGRRSFQGGGTVPFHIERFISANRCCAPDLSIVTDHKLSSEEDREAGTGHLSHRTRCDRIIAIMRLVVREIGRLREANIRLLRASITPETEPRPDIALRKNSMLRVGWVRGEVAWAEIALVISSWDLKCDQVGGAI